MASVDVPLRMDAIRKRPRTPNDPYSLLSDEQIANLSKDSQAHFHLMKPVNVPSRRFFRDRFADTKHGSHIRQKGGSGQPFCWINTKWNRFPPADHNTCLPRASVRWGTEKTGTKTLGHFQGEEWTNFTCIDLYRRHPTNLPGPVVMDHGRPGTGYYEQRNPYTTTWFDSTRPLTRARTLCDIMPKTTSDYKQFNAEEQQDTFQRCKNWPGFSDYTNRFLFRAKSASKFQDVSQALTVEREFMAPPLAILEGILNSHDIRPDDLPDRMLNAITELRAAICLAMTEEDFESYYNHIEMATSQAEYNLA